MLGWVPKAGHLELSGLDIPAEQLEAATAIDSAEWRAEFELQAELFTKLGRTMPKALSLQRELLMARI